MLRSLKEVNGYKVDAIDGKFGKIQDLYFDDHSWGIRYLMVDTGSLLKPGLQLLISPSKVGEPNWQEKKIPVLMSIEEIKASPGVYADPPVSLQQNIDLDRYHVWATTGSPIGVPVYGTSIYPINAALQGDPSLRSLKEIIDYRITATDDEIGHVEDFIGETEDWLIRYLVIDTRNLLPGRKVLVSTGWIERIDFTENKVHIDLSSKQIESGPEFNPNVPVNRKYEERLYDYYGRPAYWA